MKRFFFSVLLAAWLLPAARADIVLREDTASQVVQLGPFVDDTGAIVAGLTIDAADVRLSKNGANIVGKNSGGCTYDEVGMYACTFDATDSDTVGRLQVTVVESGALPVYHEFQVAEEAVYDACCAAGATVPATDGSGFTAIPWNASWDAQVESEAQDALVAYDPPTNAEMTARTLPTASYATSAMQTTIAGYIDTEIASLLTGVNVEQMNGNDVCGTGDAGTPWAGCP